MHNSRKVVKYIIKTTEYLTLSRNGHNQYSTAKLQSPADYCMDLVRQHDYENFLCTLLLPDECRTTAFAVRAFNIEVARVQDQVRDPLIGQMRMKFWEEAVENIYQDHVPKNPIAVELHRATKRHKLSKRYLKRLIWIRSDQLTSSTFSDIEAMEAYSESSVSSIYYLLLESLGLESVHADHAASHLGKAHGMVNLIRSVPYNSQKNVVVLPQDVLLRHNVAQETVLRGNDVQPLRDAVFDVANIAKQHLDKARSLSTTVPKAAYVLFLPAITIDAYLERLRLVDFDVFSSTLKHRSSSLPFTLYWKKLLSKY